MTSHIRFPALPPSDPQGCDLLADERAKATFNVPDLTLYMYGEEWISRMHRILDIVKNEPEFDKSRIYYMGRTDKMRHALRKDKKLVMLSQQHKWSTAEFVIAEWLIDMPSVFGVHRSMFLPTLLGQGNEEQQKRFLLPASKYEIIGCYAQTELGHGSNVQGLETTATYIPETNEFEIHSPHLTSCKWWIGGLGLAANHAVVMARLITNGVDHGPHPFVAQVRDMKTHRPLKGITVGDIGPKFGFNTTDNGFLMFDHYRIPHFNMLSKYASVEPGTGKYKKPPVAKISYGTMVFVRANIVMGVRFALARAATIAVRYSAIRRQFVDAENPKKLADGTVVETPVLDYTMQQYRLLPVIAQAYACFFTGREMLRMYQENDARSKEGDFSLLADLHASSSGLKSLTTTMAATAIEDCRRACGGHGFSSFSGYTHFYQDFLPNVTWEGDNYILTQQTTRYLLKSYRQLIQKSPPSQQDMNPTVAYLTQYLANPKVTCPASSPEDFSNPEILLAAFGHRSAHLIATAADQIDNHGRTWNSMLVDVARISKAHCQFILVQNFMLGIQRDLSANRSLKEILETLASLFALHTMEQDLGDFLASGYLTPAQSLMLRTQLQYLLAVVRPDAVSLVDAFHLPDYYLNSALGGTEGRVYETMTEWAAREPLNGITFDVNPKSEVLFRGEEAGGIRARL